MFKKALTLILIFSLALNFAFVGVWGYHRFYVKPRFDRAHRGAREQKDHDWKRFKDGEDRRREDKDDFDHELHRLLGQDKEHWRKLGKLRHSLMEQHEKLFSLLSAEQTDESAIDQCLAKISELREQMQKQIVDHVLSVKEDLGPEKSKNLLHFLRKKALGPRRDPRHRYRPGRGPDRDGKRGPEGCGRGRSLPFTFWDSRFGFFSWEGR